MALIYRRRHLLERWKITGYTLNQLLSDGILVKAITPEGRKSYWTEQQVLEAERRTEMRAAPPQNVEPNRIRPFRKGIKLREPK